MFTDPQTVTIDSVDNILPRTNNDNFSSTYNKRLESPAGQLTLRISNASGKISGGGIGKHHTVKLIREIAATPTSEKITHTAWVTFHVPDAGDASTSQNDLLALLGFIDAAAIAKLMNGES